MDIDLLRQLIRHMEWADAQVWRAVIAHEPAGHDRRLRDLLTHLHLVQRLFLVVWQKQPFDPSRGQPEFATAAELATGRIPTMRRQEGSSMRSTSRRCRPESSCRS